MSERRPKLSTLVMIENAVRVLAGALARSAFKRAEEGTAADENLEVQMACLRVERDAHRDAAEMISARIHRLAPPEKPAAGAKGNAAAPAQCGGAS